MSDEELAAIEARMNAATPGPWVAHGYEVWNIENGEEAYFIEPLPNPEDAVFIAHTPTDIAALVDEVRRLRGRGGQQGGAYGLLPACVSVATIAGAVAD